jgi:POT family proton-dependent oligopeptide transporter
MELIQVPFGNYGDWFVVAKWGWHAFGLAGIAMLLGLIVYLWGQKYLTHVGNFETRCY